MLFPKFIDLLAIRDGSGRRLFRFSDGIHPRPFGDSGWLAVRVELTAESERFRFRDEFRMIFHKRGNPLMIVPTERGERQHQNQRDGNRSSHGGSLDYRNASGYPANSSSRVIFFASITA